MEALKTCCGSKQTETKELKESLVAGLTMLQTESKATADVLQELKNEKGKVCAAYARSANNVKQKQIIWCYTPSQDRLHQGQRKQEKLDTLQEQKNILQQAVHDTEEKPENTHREYSNLKATVYGRKTGGRFERENRKSSRRTLQICG